MIQIVENPMKVITLLKLIFANKVLVENIYESFCGRFGGGGWEIELLREGPVWKYFSPARD